MSEKEVLQLVVYGSVTLVFLAIWIGMIVLGVRIAKSKNRSPHWMWFGLHPVGALITLIVMGLLKPLKLCPQCARKSPAAAKLCTYCRHAFEAPPAQTPTTAIA